MYWAKLFELPLTAARLQQALVAKAASPEPAPEPQLTPAPVAIVAPAGAAAPASDKPPPAWRLTCAHSGAVHAKVLIGCRSCKTAGLSPYPWYCSAACHRAHFDGDHEKLCPKAKKAQEQAEAERQLLEREGVGEVD